MKRKEKKVDLSRASGGGVFEKVEDAAESLADMFEKGINKSVNRVFGRKNVDKVWNKSEKVAEKVTGFFSRLTR